MQGIRRHINLRVLYARLEISLFQTSSRLAVNCAIHKRASTSILPVRVNRHEVADGVGLAVKYIQADGLLALSRIARHRTIVLQVVLQRSSHRGNALIVVARRETRDVGGDLRFLQRLLALLDLLYNLLDELQLVQQRAVDGITAVDDGF